MHGVPRSPRGTSGASTALAGNGLGAASEVPKLAALQSTVDCLERENQRLRDGLSRPASAATNGALTGANSHASANIPARPSISSCQGLRGTPMSSIASLHDWEERHFKGRRCLRCLR